MIFLVLKHGKAAGGEDGGGGLRGLLTNPHFLLPEAGIFAGTFAKMDEPGYTGQGTGLSLQDIARVANITDPKTAMASGLRFTPDLETRKFTPEEMLQSYAATWTRGIFQLRAQLMVEGLGMQVVVS